MTSKRTSVVIATAGVLAVALFSVTSVDAAAQKAASQKAVAQQESAAKKPGGGGGGGGGGKPEKLVLDLTGGNQLSAAGFGPFINLVAFDDVAGTYAPSWKSKQLRGRRRYDSAWIGDVDNDEEDEVIGFCGYLSIYESGSDGGFSYFSDFLDPVSGTNNQVMIGDVGGPEGNEVVVSLGDRVEVWKCARIPSWSCSEVWTSAVDVVNPPGKLEIGNANNEGPNDFVVGTRSTGWNAHGSVRVYSSTAGSENWTVTESEAVFGTGRFGDGAATVRDIAVGDVDGDGKNEIVATLHKFGATAADSEGWLAIWKYVEPPGTDPSGFVLVHAESLGAGSQAAGVDTGKFVEDSPEGISPEWIVVGVTRGSVSKVEVLEFNGSGFDPLALLVTGAFTGSVRVGNTDADGGLEFVVGTGDRRIQIYDHLIGTSFAQVYESPEDLYVGTISIQ